MWILTQNVAKLCLVYTKPTCFCACARAACPCLRRIIPDLSCECTRTWIHGVARRETRCQIAHTNTNTHTHKNTHKHVDSTHTHTQIQHAGKSHTYTYTNRHSHIHTHTPPHTPARVLIYAAIDTCHTPPPPHTHIPAGVLMYAVIATCHPPHTYTHTHTHTHAHLLGSWCTLGLLLVAVEGSTATSLFCVTYQTQLWCIYIYTYINKFMYVDRCIYICRYMCSHTDIDRYSYVCI